MLIFINKSGEKNLVEFSNKPIFNEVENTKSLGIVLYTEYFYLFQISGVILLVAMIGSIVLTLRERSGVKKQKIFDQINFDAKTAIQKKNAKLGEGIDV